MPALFSVITEFDLNIPDFDERKETFVGDFYNLLEVEGMKYKRGYWKAEGMEQSELVELQQKYVCGGAMAGVDGAQYQGMFEYLDFSTVQAYWEVCDNVVRFRACFPEDEAIDEAMDAILALFMDIWQHPLVVAIQTEGELSDVAPTVAEICAGCKAQIEPFAVVAEELVVDPQIVEEWACEVYQIGRGGVVLIKR